MMINDFMTKNKKVEHLNLFIFPKHICINFKLQCIKIHTCKIHCVFSVCPMNWAN